MLHALAVLQALPGPLARHSLTSGLPAAADSGSGTNIKTEAINQDALDQQEAAMITPAAA